MKKRMTWIGTALPIILIMLLIFTGSSALSMGTTQEVEKGKVPAVSSGCTLTVLNPQGPVKKERVLAPRLDTLKGKKIAMWLSSTPDVLTSGRGFELYVIMEKMLKEKYSDIRIVSFTDLPMKWMPQKDVVDAIVKTEPDAVVAGFGG